jgi:hypothetical protein
MSITTDDLIPVGVINSLDSVTVQKIRTSLIELIGGQNGAVSLVNELKAQGNTNEASSATNATAIAIVESSITSIDNILATADIDHDTLDKVALKLTAFGVSLSDLGGTDVAQAALLATLQAALLDANGEIAKLLERNTAVVATATSTTFSAATEKTFVYDGPSAGTVTIDALTSAEDGKVFMFNSTGQVLTVVAPSGVTINGSASIVTNTIAQLVYVHASTKLIWTL